MRRPDRSPVLALGLAALVLAGCTSPAAPAPSNSDTTSGRPPTAVASSAADSVLRTVQEIRDAVASAAPGQVIQVADGEYV